MIHTRKALEKTLKSALWQKDSLTTPDDMREQIDYNILVFLFTDLFGAMHKDGVEPVRLISAYSHALDEFKIKYLSPKDREKLDFEFSKMLLQNAPIKGMN